MGVEPGKTFPGGGNRVNWQYLPGCSYPAIQQLFTQEFILEKYLHKCGILHDQCETLFAGVKNHQQPKSIGKRLNKLWYIPPAVYPAAVRMKLMYVYFHDKKAPDIWVSEETNRRAIRDQFYQKKKKNDNNNVGVCVYTYIYLEKLFYLRVI